MKVNYVFKQQGHQDIFSSKRVLQSSDSDKFGKKTFSNFSNKSVELQRVLSGDSSILVPRNKEFVTYDQLKAFDAPYAGEKRNSPFYSSLQNANLLKAAGNQIILTGNKDEQTKNKQESIFNKQGDKNPSLQQTDQQENQKPTLSSQDQANFDLLIGQKTIILEEQKKELLEIKKMEESLLQQRMQRQQEIEAIIQQIESLQNQKQQIRSELRYKSGVSSQQNSKKDPTQGENRQSYSRAIQTFYGFQDQNNNQQSPSNAKVNQQSLAEIRRAKQLIPQSSNKINQTEYNSQDLTMERFSKISQKGYTNTKELII